MNTDTVVQSNIPTVKYDRELTWFTGLDGLDKIYMDFFYSTLSILRERKQVRTVITADDLIARSKYLKKNQRIYTKDDLVEVIKNMAVNVSAASYIIDDEEKFSVLSLFDSFSVDKSGNLTVEMGKSFSNVFFDIQNRFTEFLLPTFLHLKSKYSKFLYRLLLDHYTNFTISVDDMYDRLKLKSSSSRKQFLYRLPIYIKELQNTGDFENNPGISYICHKSPVGRHPIVSISFFFRENPARLQEIKKVFSALSSPAFHECDISLPLCPYCHGALRWFKNTKTGEMFIGHVDFKNCKCNPKSYPTLEALNEQIQKVKDKEEMKSNEDALKAKKAKRERENQIINEYLKKHPEEETEAPDFSHIVSHEIDEVKLPSVYDFEPGKPSKIKADEEQRHAQLLQRALAEKALTDKNTESADMDPFPKG